MAAGLREAFPEASVALVTHAHPIRTLLGYFLGIPLDLTVRLEIEPAAVSVLEVNGEGARLRLLNGERWPVPPAGS